MVLVSISLALIALLGGMFLLAKTQKDNLNLFFKVVSYFIIVVSFLSIGCIVLRGAVGMYTHRQFEAGNMRMMGERFGEGGMHMHHGMGVRGEGFHRWGMDGDHKDGDKRDGDGWRMRRQESRGEMKDSLQHRN